MEPPPRYFMSGDEISTEEEEGEDEGDEEWPETPWHAGGRRQCFHHHAGH